MKGVGACKVVYISILLCCEVIVWCRICWPVYINGTFCVVCPQVVSWIITIWVFGSLLIFVLARVLGGEVRESKFPAHDFMGTTP